MEGLDWSAVIAAADELVRALLVALGIWLTTIIRNYVKQFVVNSILSRAAGLVLAKKGEGSIVGGMVEAGVAYAQRQSPNWLGKMDEAHVADMVKAEVAKVTAGSPTTTVAAAVGDLARRVTVGAKP